MFDGCENLKSFTSKLSKMTNGKYMFNGCSSLTDFNADLSALEDGKYMFYNCMLTTTSLKNIAKSIKDVTSIGADPETGSFRTIHITLDHWPKTAEDNAAINDMLIKYWSVNVTGPTTTT
jgi:hypothetical protein